MLEGFIQSRYIHEATTFQIALQSCKMFATFRHNQGKDSLDAVRQSNDPPVLKGAHFDACRRCREKKVLKDTPGCVVLKLTSIATM